MSEIDINARLKELDYYENITNNLISTFDDWMNSNKSNNHQKVYETQRSSVDTEPIDVAKFEDSGLNKGLSEYSSVWLLPRCEKLKIYEEAIDKSGHLTEPEMSISFKDGMQQSSTSQNDDRRTFAEITKYKRDIKRKRMKYRTTKAPPLTHTEEIRSLISLQMESWEQFCNESKNIRKYKR